MKHLLTIALLIVFWPVTVVVLAAVLLQQTEQERTQDV